MNIKNVKYMNKFLRLPYPKNQMLIIGSSVMALLGIKKNKDVDIWATPAIIKLVSRNKNFISKISKFDGSTLYESKDGSVEFVPNLAPWKGTFKENMERAIMIYGIYFQSPKDLLKWKQAANRPKDKEDIRLIKAFLKKGVVESYLNIIQNLK